MLTPSSLQNKLPDCIILDTKKLVDFLRIKISTLTEVEVTEEQIIELLIEAMAYEKNVDLEIDISCDMAVRQHLGHMCGEEGCQMDAEAEETATAMAEFAGEIQQELKRIKAYKNGYLFYQFMRMLGRDVVLVKLELPDGLPLPHGV